MSGIIITKGGGSTTQTSGTSNDTDFFDGGGKLATTSSVAINENGQFADSVDPNLTFYVSGSSQFDGAVTAQAFSGSLTTLVNGDPFVVGGNGINVSTGSDGSIQISLAPNCCPTFVDLEIPSGTVDGSNNVFTLDNAPQPPESLKVVLRGLNLMYGEDYVLSGSTLTFCTEQGAAVPKSGSAFYAYYRY